MTSNAQALLTNGYVVIPTSFADPTARKQAQADFLQTLKGFPEFLPGTIYYVLGGFAALGNAASFHNPFVRNLRQKMHTELYTAVFQELLEDQYPTHNLEQLIDRMLYRPAGVAPTAESFHRDDSGGSPGDLSVGGWLNFNDQPHTLSCVPCTHSLDPAAISAAGFHKIPKAHQADMKARRLLVEIPAGHAVLFVDNLVHEVLARKCKFDLLRVFLGFRLTRDTKPLTQGLHELLMTQAVVPLKSGQVPPVYAALHLVNWFDKIQAFSTNVRTELLTDFTYKSGPRAGHTFRVAPRWMPSLEEVSRLTGTDAKYIPYTPQEIQIHFPHRPRGLN